jgi:hypothetical protein
MLFACKCVFNYFFYSKPIANTWKTAVIPYRFMLFAHRAVLLGLARRRIIINLIGDLDSILFIAGRTYRPRSDLPT